MVLTLDRLDSDVVHCILKELLARSNVHEYQYPLKCLSSTSRAMRSHCMPVLFHNCIGRYFAYAQVPPEAIRPFVRHVHYSGTFLTVKSLLACGYLSGRCVYDDFDPLERDTDPSYIGVELEYFPAVNTVSFSMAGGVPWPTLIKILQFPSITSISIDAHSMWMGVPPPPPSALLPTHCRLAQFSYTPKGWRVVENNMVGNDLQVTYALESSFLLALVLNMSGTAESLSLPVETAPLLQMAAIEWPRLHTLSLTGQYMDPEQPRMLSLLLSRAPNLRTLSVRVAQRDGTSRPPLLTERLESGFRVRSLTVAYPNPADAIFASLTDELTSLSLRDSPRYYLHQRYGWRAPLATAPLLSSSECVTILKRLSTPHLITLELVYLADEAEDELLRYLPHAFPLLSELELHRYRASDGDDIPYIHIAHILKGVKLLRTLYLNFDASLIQINDPWDEHPMWLNKKVTINQRGFDIAAVLEGGEHFERLALLVHTLRGGMWVLFRPVWWPGFQVQYCSNDRLDASAPVMPYLDG